MTYDEKSTWMKLLIWLLGTVFAALLAMILNWLPNPFHKDSEAGCKVHDKVYNLVGTKVRLFHSISKQGLASAIEIKLQSCGVKVEVADNDYKTTKANIRYYVESDSAMAGDIQIILNSVAGQHPTVGVRFVVNPRIDAQEADRKNIFHVYF